MAKTTISLKNIAIPAKTVIIRDLTDVAIPTATTLLVSDNNSYDIIAWSQDLYDAIIADEIFIVIDGVDQSKADSLVFMQSITQTGTPLSAVVANLSTNNTGTNTGDEVQGDKTTIGIWEGATIAETNTGTDDTKVITTDVLAGSQLAADVTSNNAKVSNVTTNLSIGTKTATTVDVNSSDGTNATLPAATITEAGLLAATDQVKLNNTSGINTGDEGSATTLLEGIAELATQAEVNTGTDATRIVTPDTLEDKTYGTFTGTTIPDNSTLKTALQELETAVEATVFVFGTEYQYTERITSASTTGTNIIYETLTTTNLVGGTYRLEASWVLNQTSTSGDWNLDITEGTNAAGSNTSLLVEEFDEEGIDAGFDARWPKSFTRDIVFTSGIKDINLEFDQMGPGTCNIYFGCIRLFRVA